MVNLYEVFGISVLSSILLGCIILLLVDASSNEYSSEKNKLMHKLAWFTYISLSLIISAIIYFSIKHSNEVRAADVILRTEIRPVRLLKIDPPKHYYVTYFDINANQVVNKKYISKHCNTYQKVVIGQTYYLKISYHYNPMGYRTYYSTFDNLKNTFCPQ